MDEWYHHQHNWIYLEPILKSQFAVKNLPKECATFAQADGVWRRIMKLVRDNSSTKRYGDEYQSKFTLVQLRNNNATFDSLQKALEEFMQRKREIFGRFFLLSNQELL
jgi:dynein heavy chain